MSAIDVDWKIEPDWLETDYEGFEDTAASLLSSIENEIKEGTIENGRKYAAYGKYGMSMTMRPFQIHVLAGSLCLFRMCTRS